MYVSNTQIAITLFGHLVHRWQKWVKYIHSNTIFICFCAALHFVLARAALVKIFMHLHLFISICVLESFMRNRSGKFVVCLREYAIGARSFICIVKLGGLAYLNFNLERVKCTIVLLCVVCCGCVLERLCSLWL